MSDPATRSLVTQINKTILSNAAVISKAKSSIQSKVDTAVNRGLTMILSKRLCKWLDFCSLVESQVIIPNFAAFKVGKALFVLDLRQKTTSFATSHFSFSNKEVHEAAQLLLGPHGEENVRLFNLCAHHTLKK